VTTPPILVFVVEDDELIRDLVEEALIDGSFAVARATLATKQSPC
jgi:DNA-binding response OmpR family regulator